MPGSRDKNSQMQVTSLESLRINEFIEKDAK